MLLGAVARWPYGYYQILRWATCAAAVYVAYNAYQWRKLWAVYLFGVVAVLFNPLAPIHLSRGTWQVVDPAAALAFLVAAVVLFKPVPEQTGSG